MNARNFGPPSANAVTACASYRSVVWPERVHRLMLGQQRRVRPRFLDRSERCPGVRHDLRLQAPSPLVEALADDAGHALEHALGRAPAPLTVDDEAGDGARQPRRSHGQRLLQAVQADRIAQIRVRVLPRLLRSQGDRRVRQVLEPFRVLLRLGLDEEVV